MRLERAAETGTAARPLIGTPHQSLGRDFEGRVWSHGVATRHVSLLITGDGVVLSIRQLSRR